MGAATRANFSVEGRGKRPVAQKRRGDLVRRNSAKMDFSGIDKVPVFDGRGTSFMDFEQRVRYLEAPDEDGTREPLIIISFACTLGPAASTPC